MIDCEITKRTLKKDLFQSIWTERRLLLRWNCERIASKGDIVDTFRYQPGKDLWVRIGKFDVVVWWWEIDDTFESEDTPPKPEKVDYKEKKYEFGFGDIDNKQ